MTGPTVVLATSQQLWWFVARSSGLVAWALVSAAVLWGLAASSRLARRPGLPAWVTDLHRFLGTLSLVFTAVHLVGLWADTYVSFGPAELFVPMASRWKPGPVAWGVAGWYLLLAVQLTSWMKRRLPRRLWHAVHLGSIPLFVVSTVHAVTAGTDAGGRGLQWTGVVVIALVVGALTYRLLAVPPRRRRARAAGGRTATGAPAAAAR